MIKNRKGTNLFIEEENKSIYESDKIIYLTKTSMTKEAAEKKLKEFIDNNYEFCIGVILHILIWEKLRL